MNHESKFSILYSNNYLKDNYFISLVDSNISQTIPDLICSICLEVLVEPIQTKCLHVFCKKCLKKALEDKLQCPKDRVPLSITSLSKFQESNPVGYRILFGTLKVFCPLYYNQGCNWKGNYIDMDTHLDNDCIYHPRPCCYCSEKFPSKDLMMHHLVCALRPIACQFCHEVHPFSKIQEHQEMKCLRAPILCYEELIKRNKQQQINNNNNNNTIDQDNKCMETMLRSEFLKHEATTCPKAWISCPLAPECKVGKHIQREQLSEHMIKFQSDHIEMIGYATVAQQLYMNAQISQIKYEHSILNTRLEKMNSIIELHYHNFFSS